MSMDLEEMTKVMYEMASPSKAQFPGNVNSNGIDRVMCLLVAMYLAEDDEVMEPSIMEILRDDYEESDSTMIGLGFAGALQRNLGNRYASGMITECLVHYNGKEVTEKVGELLRVLENYLVQSGDARKGEGETEH